MIEILIKFPDEQVLKANLEFLSYILIQTRRLAYDRVSHEQIADIMDVVHNLPDDLLNWGKWDQDHFISFLKKYDQKWPNKIKQNNLSNIYNEITIQRS